MILTTLFISKVQKMFYLFADLDPTTISIYLTHHDCVCISPQKHNSSKDPNNTTPISIKCYIIPREGPRDIKTHDLWPLDCTCIVIAYVDSFLLPF